MRWLTGIVLLALLIVLIAWLWVANPSGIMTVETPPADSNPQMESQAGSQVEEAADQTPESAPDRRLVGVLSKGDAYTHAVIEQVNNRSQAVYGLGDSVEPDDSQVIEIHANRVVLLSPRDKRLVLFLEGRADAGAGEDEVLDPDEAVTPEVAALLRGERLNIEEEDLLEQAFGPDPYRACWNRADEEQCAEDIREKVQQLIEKCDAAPDSRAHERCIRAALSLQDDPAFE